MLNEQVLLLSKKHGQLKQAITKMVQVVMGFLDDVPSMDPKLALIDTLRTVTEGKVIVAPLEMNCVFGLWPLGVTFIFILVG